MSNSDQSEWGLDELFERYPNFSDLPGKNGSLVVRGRIVDQVQVPSGKLYNLDYRVEIEVPKQFPAGYPRVIETDGKIPEDYHKLVGNYLCLGSPLRLQLMTAKGRTLPAFIETILLPYLTNHSAFKVGEPLPFGELGHGEWSLLDDYAALFDLPDRISAYLMLRLLSKSAQFAKNQPCPCGSGKKMKHCHQKTIVPLRKYISPAHFREAYERVRKERDRIKSKSEEDSGKTASVLSE